MQARKRTKSNLSRFMKPVLIFAIIDEAEEKDSETMALFLCCATTNHIKEVLTITTYDGEKIEFRLILTVAIIVTNQGVPRVA